MFFKKQDKLITHSGSFHSDDVFAAATLHLYYKKIKKSYRLIRTVNSEIIKTGTIVFDIGGEYDEEKNLFDHHQKGGAGKRENGIPYAAFGLVWKKFGSIICENEEISKLIDIHLVQAIDAGDNGVNISSNIYDGVHPVFVQNLLQSFNPTYKEDYISTDKRFDEAMSIAMLYLERVIHQTKIQYNISQHVKEIYHNQDNKEILIVEESFGRNELTIAVNDLVSVLYFIYPSKREDGWNICAARVSLDSFESKKPFPESWRGLQGENLAKISGVETAYFCHNSGFLCAAKTREDAVLLAKKSLER